MISIIKLYCILLFSIIISFRIINHKVSLKHGCFILILSLILLSISYTTSIFIPELTYITPIFILWIVVGYNTQAPQIAFVSTLISFALSYCSHSLVSLVLLIVLTPIYYENSNFSYFPLTLLTFVAQLFIFLNIFKIKRFKRGMPFLHKNSFLNFATIASFCVLMLSTFTIFKNHSFYIRLFSLIIFPGIAAFLIHWWQAQITKSYKQSLMMRELDSLRIEVEEKEKEIKLLKQQNEELGRLIHHDNKRIPAMEAAVCEYLVCDFHDVADMKERANALRLEIESLSRNRSKTLKEIYTQKSNSYATEIGALDTLLNYMLKRAAEDSIEFHVHNTLHLSDYVPKHITVEEFTHLLSDLLENALIATALSDTKIIQLQFYVSEKRFVIEVADSGIPFEAKSIVNFGLSRLTTHESTGGSGIGLMDIWKLKETYGATLHIEEYQAPSPFSKKISLVFNHKNMYSIRTYRAEEIGALSKRNDLRIYKDNE